MESNEKFLERIKKDVHALGDTPPQQSVPVTMLTYSRLFRMAGKGIAAEGLIRSLEFNCLKSTFISPAIVQGMLEEWY